MKRVALLCVVVLLAGSATRRPAAASGSFGVDDPEGMLPPECWVANINLKNIGSDLPTPAASYVSSGKCNIRYSSNNRGVESTFDKTKVVSTIDWTAEGTYQPLQKNTWEDIRIRQVYLDRPGFVSEGTLSGWVTCATDPWREPDGKPCGSPGYKTAGTIEPAVARFYGKGLRVPLTSILSAAQHAALKSAYQAAVQKAQQIRVVAAPSAERNAASSFAFGPALPSVTSPTANQLFVENTPIPIKLTSPKSLGAASYLVHLETKDANGVWRAHATIPVGVAQAQSPAGFTGFGAGAPPAYLALPGQWRINAQVSSPKQSGASPWVEFSVMSHTRKKR